MKKPNIVFVFADQMRASSMGCMGEEGVYTPNLDAFAMEGTLFTRAISNNPVCGPTRATIMTGLHTQNHGVVHNDLQLRPDVKCLAEYLSDEGYKCGYIGKWHIDCPDRGIFIPPGPRRRGFDDFWAVCNCNHDYNNAYYYLNDCDEPVWVEGYEPEAQTEIAVDYIKKKAESDEAFCMFLSWGTPHCPYRYVPQKYIDMYPEDDIKLRPNAVETADRSVIAGYYAHITALDEYFGKLMQAINKAGIKENTIVIFTSDHGDMLYSQNRGWKDKPWRESVGIPFIIRWPEKVPAGRRTRGLLGLVDVMPTLLSMAGVKVPEDVDGKDLTELIYGNDEAAPESQLIYMIMEPFVNSYREWRGVVTMTHTYARFKKKEWVFYNDDKDPYQMDNLAGVSGHEKEREEVESELEKWMQKLNDPFDSTPDVQKKYVNNKIVTSADKNKIWGYLLEEAEKWLTYCGNDAGRAEEYLTFPNEKAMHPYFDNEKIRNGKKGIGRKLFHKDFFMKADI